MQAAGPVDRRRAGASSGRSPIRCSTDAAAADSPTLSLRPSAKAATPSGRCHPRHARPARRQHVVELVAPERRSRRADVAAATASGRTGLVQPQVHARLRARLVDRHGVADLDLATGRARPRAGGRTRAASPDRRDGCRCTWRERPDDGQPVQHRGGARGPTTARRRLIAPHVAATQQPRADADGSAALAGQPGPAPQVRTSSAGSAPRRGQLGRRCGRRRSGRG